MCCDIPGSATSFLQFPSTSSGGCLQDPTACYKLSSPLSPAPISKAEHASIRQAHSWSRYNVFFYFNLIPLANSMDCSLFVFITRNIGDKRMVLLEGLILQCVRNLVDFIPYFFFLKKKKTWFGSLSVFSPKLSSFYPSSQYSYKDGVGSWPDSPRFRVLIQAFI